MSMSYKKYTKINYDPPKTKWYMFITIWSMRVREINIYNFNILLCFSIKTQHIKTKGTSLER